MQSVIDFYKTKQPVKLIIKMVSQAVLLFSCMDCS